ncbi:hypothetical protein ABBQ38_009107 [Trebouxia sp. C0009 RCD-2024]
MPLAKPLESRGMAMFASEVLPDIPQAGSDLAELSTWDLLQDLDFGGVGNSSLPQGSSGIIPASSSDRLKEKNRKAQKRFRERKKERAQTTEAQLAETTSQLHNLRLKQRELEARNSLLEKIATLNKQQTLPDSSRLSATTQDGVPTARQVHEL